MKKFKNLINIILVMILMVLPYFSISGFTPEIDARAVEPPVKDSLFFIDPSIVRVKDDKVYVYDSSDEKIKVINKQDKDKGFESGFSVGKISDFDFFGKNILLYDKTNTLRAIDAQTQEQLEVENSSILTTLTTCKSMRIISSNETNYILLCPTNPTTEDFEVAKLDLQDKKLTITDLHTFKVASRWSDSVDDYDLVYTREDEENKTIIMFVKNNGICSITITPSSPTAEVGTATDVKISDSSSYTQTERIEHLGDVNLDQDCIAITTNENIRFYTLMTDENTTLTAIEGKNISLLEDYDADCVSTSNKTIARVSNEHQVLYIYDLSGDPFSKLTYVNKAVQSKLFADEQFKYMRVDSASAIFPTPYSKQADALTTLEEGDNVVIIGKGIYEDDESEISGWAYCMFTKDAKNYYGYVLSSSISELAQTTYSREVLTVKAFTNIYSRPSTIVDERNLVVRQIEASSSARLIVLSSICDYTTKNGENSVKYLKVAVNGQDGQVGYVDRSRVIELNADESRVSPDATVIHDDSQIFTEKNDKSEVITTLDKGTRVRVIGKRDTITNLTHVEFNDEHGNRLEGYIYTYNIEADSWNTVQVIGMILVIINVILLVVIVCIKNSLTR